MSNGTRNGNEKAVRSTPLRDRLISAALDLLIGAALLISLIAAGVGIRALLYRDELPHKSEIHIVTEPLSEGHRALISIGDDVYDTLTKRRVGAITALGVRDNGAVAITVAAERTPKGNSLRTALVWFEYTEEDACEVRESG